MEWMERRQLLCAILERSKRIVGYNPSFSEVTWKELGEKVEGEGIHDMGSQLIVHFLMKWKGKGQPKVDKEDLEGSYSMGG